MASMSAAWSRTAIPRMSRGFLTGRNQALLGRDLLFQYVASGRLLHELRVERGDGRIHVRYEPVDSLEAALSVSKFSSAPRRHFDRDRATGLPLVG
jgi:hypothetical protein